MLKIQKPVVLCFVVLTSVLPCISLSILSINEIPV